MEILRDLEISRDVDGNFDRKNERYTSSFELIEESI